MSEALDFVKQNAEGKDLSVLPGSIKWVVDSQIVFMNPDNGEITFWYIKPPIAIFVG